jgi:hypothetical protein
MMAVSSFVRGDFTLKEARPRKLAAPMYFDFGWQIYNSVRELPFCADVVPSSDGNGRFRQRYV